MKKEKLVSQAEFARRVGCGRSYINELTQAGKLPTVGTRVILDTPEANEVLQTREKSMQAEREKKDRSERKAILELKKTEQQGLNLDIKNRQLRGKLRDAKFQDEAFFSLLQTAVDRMRGVTSVLDQVIAAAISEGFDSRAESEALIHNTLDDAADDIGEQWRELIAAWRSTSVVMSGAEKIADG